MQQCCSSCNGSFEITSDDNRFLAMFEVPAPAMCPSCRLQRRLCERNTRSLYYRKCDLSGKQIVSQYNTDQSFPVYEVSEWISDKWDALSYGRLVDFSRPFFPQFQELLNIVPHMSLFNTPGTMENSEYNNATGYLKNCYLLCESDICEDSFYSNLLKNAKDVVDCSVCYTCEQCYECIDCTNCHSLFWSQDCKQCSDSYFLQNCQSCKDCIGCINQRNKQYMIANVQYSKEDYLQHKKLSKLDTRMGAEQVRESSEAFFRTQPYRALNIEQCENATGDRLFHCKNAYECFDCQDLEDCRYCERLSLHCKTCMDFNSWGQNSELVYQCSACGDRTYNSKFCSTCITVTNAEYCFECLHCRDIFGCIGLKQKQYCIFNVQYSEEEYHALRKKLIAHMKETKEYGEYFPMKLCAFAYNESFAPDLFPMTKEEVLSRGWRWYEEQKNNKHYMGPSVELPETIQETSDDICKQILCCKATAKPYKIIPQELKFYRSMNIPVPALCPDERHRRRTTKRTPYTLIQRTCGKCGQVTSSTYSEETAHTVYCESCYLETVY